MVSIAVTTAEPTDMPHALQTISIAQQRIVQDRDASIRNFFERADANGPDEAPQNYANTPTELNTVVDKVREQWEHLSALQAQLQVVKLHSQQDTLGTKKGRLVVRMLAGLTVFTTLGEVGVAIADIFAVDKIGANIATNAAVGALIVLVVGFITGLAHHIHSKFQAEQEAASRLSQEDVEDTRSLLNLLRQWQKLQRSPHDKEREQQFLLQLNNTKESVFNASVEREVWIAHYIQTLPEDHPLRQQMAEVYALAEEHQHTVDTSHQTHSLVDDDADELQQGDGHFDLENPPRNSAKFELASACQQLQDYVKGDTLKYFVYNGQRLANPLFVTTDDD